MCVGRKIGTLSVVIGIGSLYFHSLNDVKFGGKGTVLSFYYLVVVDNGKEDIVARTITIILISPSRMHILYHLA